MHMWILRVKPTAALLSDGLALTSESGGWLVPAAGWGGMGGPILQAPRRKGMEVRGSLGRKDPGYAVQATDRRLCLTCPVVHSVTRPANEGVPPGCIACLSI